jgi:hypothetical protein
MWHRRDHADTDTYTDAYTVPGAHGVALLVSLAPVRA